MTTLTLVDDHDLIRRGLRDALGQDAGLSVVGEAGSWQELQPLLATQPCDVLVLDINLPGGLSGLQILEQIAGRPGAPRVLVLSMYPEDQYAMKALRAGALGYVNKSAGSGVLIEAIHTVAQGRKFITPAVASLLVDELVSPAPVLPHQRLSEREQQLLVLIASGEKLPDIAQRLDMTPKTVSVYRARLMEKMKFAGNAEIAHYAQKHGLVG
jgi:two-component system, NarL family, invasion response regulator UvrY